MRSQFTRSKYSTIEGSARGQPHRLAGGAGILLVFSLLAACGGGGGDDIDCESMPENGPDVEECDTGSDNDNGGDSGGDGGSAKPGVSEIPLDELRAHLGNTPSEDLPPKLDEWERNMSQYGHDTGQYIQSGADRKSRRKATYYDGQRVFMQIAEYLGERQPWTGYAETASSLYRDYVDSNDGNISGYWRFSHGSLVDHQTNGDSSALDYILTLRDEPSFSDPTRSIASGWYKHIRSREVAYALQSQMVAEKAGEPRQEEKVELFVDMALGHIEIWTTGDFLISDTDRQFVQAFMAGLTSTALIEYYERSVELGDPDERVLPAVRKMADWLWDEMWVAGGEGSKFGAFEYVQPSTSGVGSESPSGDLNMLIAPMYGWLYKETGESRFLKRGDQVFGGGVELAWLGGGKQFNQNYRDSFDFLRWRQEGVERFGG